MGIKSIFSGGIGRIINQDGAPGQYSANMIPIPHDRDRNRGGVLESLTSLKSNNMSELGSLRMGSVQKPVNESPNAKKKKKHNKRS